MLFTCNIKTSISRVAYTTFKPIQHYIRILLYYVKHINEIKIRITSLYRQTVNRVIIISFISETNVLVTNHLLACKLTRMPPAPSFAAASFIRRYTSAVKNSVLAPSLEKLQCHRKCK